MTHISRKKLPTKSEKVYLELLTYLLSNLKASEVNAISTVILTKTEQIMLLKRVAIIYFLNNGVSTNKIAEMTSTTPQTVKRIELTIQTLPPEKLKLVLKKISRWGKISSLKAMIKEISNLPISRSEFKKKIRPF